MYPLYTDLRERLGEPLWHDSHGVPRYAPFHPTMLGVYDDWAALFEVTCCGCGQRFECGAGMHALGVTLRRSNRGQESLEGLTSDEDRRRWLERVHAELDCPKGATDHLVDWGDAPWHTLPEGGQCPGTTMGVDLGPVLQLWHKVRGEWVRADEKNEVLYPEPPRPQPFFSGDTAHAANARFIAAAREAVPKLIAEVRRIQQMFDDLTTEALPEGLARLVDPELSDPRWSWEIDEEWRRTLARIHHQGRRPQSPDDWLLLFLTLRRML